MHQKASLKLSRKTRLLVLVSRMVNVLVFDGHVNQMVSSRAYEEDWKLKPWIDQYFKIFHGEENHCEESWKLEYGLITKRYNQQLNTTRNSLEAILGLVVLLILIGVFIRLSEAVFQYWR